MLFEELNGVDSECRSYLVADGGEALVVDPLLERVDDYLARLDAIGATGRTDLPTGDAEEE